MSTRITARLLPVLALALLLPALAACGGGGGGSKFPKVLTIQKDDLVPQLVNSELSVGQNRFSIGLLTQDGAPVVDAKVHLAFYDLNGGKEVKKFEADAASVVPARDSGITEQVVHIHPDGTKHIHVNAGDDVGVYTALVNFDEPGDWGVEMAIDSSKPDYHKTLLPRFNVLSQSQTPAVGSPAPRSHNLTAKDVSDLSQIDSSANPSAEMHTSTIADTIAAGRPALVLFAAPGYCESRFCGPEYEIMRKLYPQYKDRAEFIHVEFYNDPASPNRTPVDAAKEWRLQSEPWFFVIDSKGIITAKFEGPTSLQELDAALKAVAPGT